MKDTLKRYSSSPRERAAALIQRVEAEAETAGHQTEVEDLLIKSGENRAPKAAQGERIMVMKLVIAAILGFLAFKLFKKPVGVEEKAEE